MNDDNHPALHPVRANRIPDGSWRPAGIETLPPDWVNVRLWARDESGREIYITEPCPGIVHIESSVTEIVLTEADVDENLYDEDGEPYDPRPVVIDTVAADPPHLHRHYVSPDWLPAYLGGGYVGTVPDDQVAQLLARQGFADAIPRPSAR
ncbi:hypothetical protein [Mycolicibacterium sphagni]|uniref:hypothetical protein n=1 Tax=Mycolicibacterium sphagni TaxID=1786 RepID=UPI0021F3A7E1|nr:hypothetical protein [Mycolicibacterium sphagni]MCV7176158.1 hypothetical protein [Mycolicibacterium sphagni]